MHADFESDKGDRNCTNDRNTEEDIPQPDDPSLLKKSSSFLISQIAQTAFAIIVGRAHAFAFWLTNEPVMTSDNTLQPVLQGKLKHVGERLDKLMF